MLAALVEAFFELIFEFAIWGIGARWIIVAFLLISAIVCFANELYAASAILVGSSVALALWPKLKDQRES